MPKKDGAGAAAAAKQNDNKIPAVHKKKKKPAKTTFSAKCELTVRVKDSKESVTSDVTKIDVTLGGYEISYNAGKSDFSRAVISLKSVADQSEDTVILKRGPNEHNGTNVDFNTLNLSIMGLGTVDAEGYRA